MTPTPLQKLERFIKLQKRTEITQSNQEHHNYTQVNLLKSKGSPKHPMTQPFANSTKGPSKFKAALLLPKLNTNESPFKI
jgi:hypothetical protein